LLRERSQSLPHTAADMLGWENSGFSSARLSRTCMNHSNRRRSLPLAARRPTRASSSRSMTTATSSRRSRRAARDRHPQPL